MALFGKARCMLQHKIMSHMGQGISASTPFLFQAIRCMSSKLFVGGLPYQVDEGTLRQTFEKYGQVYEARVILDRQTGNSRGFGFVTFESTEAANSAIMALDGQELQGRRIKVNHAHDRGQGYGGGGGFGGNYQGDGSFGGNYQGGRGYGGNYQGSGDYGGNYQGGGGYGGNYQGGGDYGGNYQGGTGYNNYGDNYQGGAENYSNYPGGVTGYNTAGEGSYDNNYASSRGNYSSAGGNHPSSGGNLDTGGDFPRVEHFDGGALHNESHFQPPGVAFGGADNDNYNADGSNVGSNFTPSGYENTPGSSYDGGDQFGKNANGDVAYDDESNDYQDRRAS